LKNLSLILNGVLLIAVIVLFILVLPLKKQNQVLQLMLIPLPVADKGIVYINIDSVLSKYDMLHRSVE
jgi:hypothetical protein